MSRSSASAPSLEVVFSQIEAAIIAWCESTGINCFYKIPPFDFKEFKSFFVSGFNKHEKENFLINNGLAVASAASLFFENSVRLENTGISANHVVQHFRQNHVTHEISPHDIKYFPFLRDAPNYACSGLFGYDDVNWFN